MASESLGVLVRGTSRILIPQSQIHAPWPWEKQHHMLDSNSESVLHSWEHYLTHTKYYHPVGLPWWLRQ